MSKELTPVQQFQTMLATDKVQHGFGAVLPEDVPLERFTAVVVRAVQEDPTILDADRASLLLACQDAAKDGLIPDKREGALVLRSTKVNGQWIKKVTWQPMVGGIRKNLAKAGFDIRAEVVYDADLFDQELGDNPQITHKPPPLGDKRGDVIGAYAIATHIATGTKYRETMSYEELENIRSLAQTDYVWKAHTNEMYRKTVARKLAKYLPITGDDDRLQAMLDRDNEHFVDTASDGPTQTAKDVQAEIRKPAPKKKTAKKLPKVNKPPKVVTEAAPPPEPVEPEAGDPGPDMPDDEALLDDDPDNPGF